MTPNPPPPAALVLTALLSVAALAPAGALAAPTDPVTVELPPEDQGPPFVPGVRLVEDLPREYVEEEYFVAGRATLFSYANDPPLGPTDLVDIGEDDYRTRIIVRRPANPHHFKGTVVIEWWNSSAGFDSAPVWDPSAEFFARRGWIYVGVTNSTTALDFLVDGCPTLGFLPPSCGTRYATLSLPENGLAYEMVSQIANLLKSHDPENPLAGYRVKRIFHSGQSQQGGSMVTYASAFDFPVNDGYFVQAAATARPINFGPACGEAGSPPFPDCTPRLQGDDRLVRTDLPKPVYHIVSELDLEELFGIVGRQEDTPTFRYYEVAGGAHNTVHEDVEILPAGAVGNPEPIFLEDLCAFQPNSTADGPIFQSYVTNALWSNLERQVRFHRTPPAGVLMDVDDTGAVLRDEFGNGLGGIRLPQIEVPQATFVPGNQAADGLDPLLTFIGNLACRLTGSVEPFDAETIAELYPNAGSFLGPSFAQIARLQRHRFLLPADAAKLKQLLLETNPACGIGFELVFVLPPLLWLRRRRRSSVGGSTL